MYWDLVNCTGTWIAFSINRAQVNLLVIYEIYIKDTIPALQPVQYNTLKLKPIL